MHHLHLLRHAKSSYPEGVDDAERPLSRRGREAACRVAENLPEALGALDLVLCSTALRTRETAELVLAGFAVTPRIVYEDGLYLAGRAVLVRRLRGLDESAGAVMVIGTTLGCTNWRSPSPHPTRHASGCSPPASFPPPRGRVSRSIRPGRASTGRATR
jgi:hypothetical protein